MPGRWLTRGAYPILIAYCRHTCRARLLQRQVDLFQESWLVEDGGLERYNALLAMCDRETRALLSCARALRLSPSSQMHARTAARMVNDVPLLLPWTRGGKEGLPRSTEDADAD